MLPFLAFLLRMTWVHPRILTRTSGSRQCGGASARLSLSRGERNEGRRNWRNESTLLFVSFSAGQRTIQTKKIVMLPFLSLLPFLPLKNKSWNLGLSEKLLAPVSPAYDLGASEYLDEDIRLTAVRRCIRASFTVTRRTQRRQEKLEKRVRSLISIFLSRSENNSN